MQGSTQASSTADREIVVTRTFAAPRDLVYKVWTDPEHVAKWWGPSGFTNTILEMDVRPGGVWRLVMHGPDGTDYPNRIVFREVVENERLVYDHDDDGDGAIRFHVTATFEDVDGRSTRLTMRSVFPTAEMLRMVVEKHGAVEGAVQMMERLAVYLGGTRD